MEDASNLPMPGSAAPSETWVSQVGSHEEAAALPRANRVGAEGRGGDQSGREPATGSAFSPAQVKPVEETPPQVVSEAVRATSLASSMAGTRLTSPQEAVGQVVEPGVIRSEDSHQRRIAQPQSASPTSSMLSVILRADMTEEELDEAAKRLRPSLGEEISTRLARKYQGTISGMLKRKVRYADILTGLENGPDGASFREQFKGDHKKLGRYIREKCPKN